MLEFTALIAANSSKAPDDFGVLQMLGVLAFMLAVVIATLAFKQKVAPDANRRAFEYGFRLGKGGESVTGPASVSNNVAAKCLSCGREVQIGSTCSGCGRVA